MKKNEKNILIKDNFMQFAEQVDIAIYQFTPTLDKIIYLNPAFEKIWGDSRESFYDPQKVILK